MDFLYQISYINGKKEISYLHAAPVNRPVYPKYEKRKENWVYIISSPTK